MKFSLYIILCTFLNIEYGKIIPVTSSSKTSEKGKYTVTMVNIQSEKIAISIPVV